MAPKAKKGRDKKEPDKDPDRKERGKPTKKKTKEPKKPRAKKRLSLENVIPSWLRRVSGGGRAPDPNLPGPSRPTYKTAEPIDEDISLVGRKPTTKGTAHRIPTGAISKRPKKPPSHKYFDSDSSDDEYHEIDRPSSKGTRGKTSPKRRKNIPAEDASDHEQGEMWKIYSRHAPSTVFQPSVRPPSEEGSQYEISGIIRGSHSPLNFNRYMSWSRDGLDASSDASNKAREPSLKLPKNYEEFRLAVTSARPIVSYYPLFHHFQKSKKTRDVMDDVTLSLLRQCVLEECKIAIKLFKRFQLCVEMNKTSPEMDIFNILFQLKDMQRHFVNTIAEMEKLGSDELIMFIEVSDKHYSSAQNMIEDLKSTEQAASPYLFGTYNYIVMKIQEILSELEPMDPMGM